MQNRFVALTHPLAHVSMGLLLTVTICPFEYQYLIVGGLASLLPDFDINIGLPHRAQSHSVLPPLILYVFYAISPDKIVLAILAGYVSHLFVDLLHGNGIMLFYPITRTMVSFARVETQYIFYFSIPLLMFAIITPPAEPPVTKMFVVPTATAITATPTDFHGMHFTISTRQGDNATPTATPLFDNYRRMFFSTPTPTIDWGIPAFPETP